MEYGGYVMDNKHEDIVMASQLGWAVYDSQDEAIENWMRAGWCDICKRWKTNLNKVQPNRGVAQYYDLTKPSWVCSDCWDKYEYDCRHQKVYKLRGFYSI